MILDVCCGSLLMYHGMHKKLGDDFVYMDMRVRHRTIKREHTLIRPIEPMIRADLRHLPFRPNLFDGIVCDPPMNKAQSGIFFLKYYAWNTHDIVNHMRKANEEFKRVLKDNGFLFLKIMRARSILYKTLLSNFVFFIPIQFRAQNRGLNWVQWMIGQVRSHA